jgi:cyclopropane-fatty-acyl-phospholipid synthase
MVQTSLTKTADHAVEIGLSFLKNLLGSYHPRDFAVRFWDSTMWEAEAGQLPRFTLVLQHPGALRKMFLPPSELNLGEAYIYNDFDIEGDIEAIFPIAEQLITKKSRKVELLRYGKDLLKLPKTQQSRSADASAKLRGTRHSKERDRQAISYHYDRNAFYKLFLDRHLVYSCAYFATPDEDLDTAQERKLDYICRKLRLRPRDRLLDIGCGWGGLVIHAAQRYGARAYGITLSQQQAELAQERIRQAGLAEQCQVEVRDYRDMTKPNSDDKLFDKMVSVGMFEHVGEALLTTYFKQAWSLLRPGGVFLNHGIASNALAGLERGPTFVTKYVFPDGELVPISTTVRAAEMNGFEVRDIESLREHYTLTLRHWVRRLEAHADEARELADDVTYRIWRLYMAGSAYRFQVGQINLYQVLLVKPDQGKSGLPLSRSDWYGVPHNVLQSEG